MHNAIEENHLKGSKEVRISQAFWQTRGHSCEYLQHKGFVNIPLGNSSYTTLLSWAKTQRERQKN